MKQIDFKNFRLYDDISQKKTTTIDIRHEFADLMYRNLNGIVAHDLALRIYRTEEPIQLNEEEEKTVVCLAEKGRPIFLDSLRNNLVVIDEGQAQ